MNEYYIIFEIRIYKCRKNKINNSRKRKCNLTMINN